MAAEANSVGNAVGILNGVCVNHARQIHHREGLRIGLRPLYLRRGMLEGGLILRIRGVVAPRELA